MSLPLHPNKFCTVDAVCKLGSYPVPKEGRFVATMDKITTQELGGAIVFETANPPNHPRNKCLGFLLDQIFSDFNANTNIPSIDTLVVKHSSHNPKIAETHPSSPETPLYNTSTGQLSELVPPTNSDKSRRKWRCIC